MDGWMDDRHFGYKTNLNPKIKPTALEWHQRTTNENTNPFE
jgi:hypothetical protein